MTSTSEMRDLHDLVVQGKKLRAELIKLAECLHKHHRNVKVAKLFGSGSSLVGGVVTVVSAVAAPVTGGLTLPFAGAGMMLTAAGGVVKDGASLAQTIIEACNVVALQKEYDEFIIAVINEYLILYEASKIYSAKIIGNASLFVTGFMLTNNNMNQLKGVGLKEAAKRLSTGATQVGKAAKDGGLKKLAKLGGSAIGKELFFLNVALIPINFIDLVSTAVDLSENSQSKASQVLLKMADMTRWIVDDLIKKDGMYSSLPDYYKALLQ
ncbi:uncharacterized protein LOC112567293 [Pomacea canaliculata]|uniref:uncharacterized protein LOC112567293 n=1 Tax=Pomacea canaliculata TaxID=400727 RepID=UPI000D737FEE|nr:uncharacterized protein LOC112567293 [Pomacea canaliculata]